LIITKLERLIVGEHQP